MKLKVTKRTENTRKGDKGEGVLFKQYCFLLVVIVNLHEQELMNPDLAKAETNCRMTVPD